MPVIAGTYELRFKHGSFHDFETGLTINREEQVEIAEPVGAATEAAITNGRLVYVPEPKAGKKAAAKSEKGPNDK